MHSTSSMSSARRNKLQLIREREAVKARLGRLQTMLLQKLTHKYGSKRNASSRLNKEIEEEVKAFTARSTGQPTDQDFLELENNVRELRVKYCKSGDSVTSRQSGDDRAASSSGHREATPGSSKKGKSSGVDGAENGRTSDGDTLPLSIARAWRTFDVAKQIEYERKEQEKAEKSRQQKIIFRQELEVHRTQQAKKKVEEEEERRRQMEEQERKLAEFRAEQEAIKKRAADRHAEEKCLREQQVKRLQAEKEVERQARLEREMQDIELCKAQLQSEVNDMERRRKAEKDRLASIQAENLKQREVRAQKQRESDDADAKLLKEHRQRVDEEERQRAAKLQDRIKRYEEIGNFWSERGVGRAQADADKREELLTLKEARRKEEAHIERERKESEKKRMATIVMATENRKVIEQKNALNQKKQKEDLEFAQRFINDSETFRQEEKDKKIHKKAAMARYRKDLERQVEETKARRKHEDMNDTEFKLNSDLVKRLESDKQMVAQVRQRMEGAT